MKNLKKLMAIIFIIFSSNNLYSFEKYDYFVRNEKTVSVNPTEIIYEYNYRLKEKSSYLTTSIDLVGESEFLSIPTTKETVLELLFVTAAFIDGLQTKEFIEKKRRNGEKGRWEKNPFFTENPSQEEVNIKITLGILSHVFVFWAMPEKYRELWSMSFLTLEVDAITHNYGISGTWGF